MRQVVEFQIGHHTDKNVPGWDGCRGVRRWVSLKNPAKCPVCGDNAPVVETRTRVDFGSIFNLFKLRTN